MIFNSFQFAIFFVLVLGAYWQLRWKGQNRLLLVMSYVFYGWWDWRFLGLLALSTGVDFLVARRLGRTDDGPHRKRLLWASMAVNLGILGFFKYFGFFADSLEASLSSVGVGWLAPSLGIVLPVGISFYTFQSMSYTIDVYRRELDPVEDFFDFALYVSYFPQLVAGPIERATRLVPQILSPRVRPRGEQISSGLALIAVGLVKKVAIADIAASVANDVFSRSGEASAIELIIGVYCFAIQIYGDFSGYSDMARGTSRLLGIELVENFKQPYFSPSITQFWRRWHISLSNWLRDYLYIPLGGNRKGPRRTYINLALTMLLGGLWHGAAWTFVVWGALQGLYLMVERRFGLDKVGSSRLAVVGRTPGHVPSHLPGMDLLPGRRLRSGRRGHHRYCHASGWGLPDAGDRQLLPTDGAAVDPDRPDPDSNRHRCRNPSPPTSAAGCGLWLGLRPRPSRLGGPTGSLRLLPVLRTHVLETERAAQAATPTPRIPVPECAAGSRRRCGNGRAVGGHPGWPSARPVGHSSTGPGRTRRRRGGRVGGQVRRRPIGLR